MLRILLIPAAYLAIGAAVAHGAESRPLATCNDGATMYSTTGKHTGACQGGLDTLLESDDTMLSLMLAITLQFQPIAVNATPRHWTMPAVVITAHVPNTAQCDAYDALFARSCVQDPETEDFDCSASDAAIKRAFKACQTSRDTRVKAIRAKLSADDDGGTIYLDGGPSVYDVAGTAERGDCQWYGPRLDGTDIRVCAGSVVAVRLGSDVREVR